MDSRDKTTDDETANAPTLEGVGDRYEVLEVIGSGGAGVVFKARDKTLDKVFAIKKLHRTNDSTQAVRFHREAKILAALKHPNLMGAVDFGFTDKNEPYLVLDYVQGRTLADWLDENGAMPIPLALAAFIDIARGLEHAHAKNIVHRDLKPSNVMIVEEHLGKETFKAQILDFGLAHSESSQTHTKAGAVFGSPRYMSPEQIESKAVDGRSDIYSFGCLMFETLTNSQAFDGNSVLEIFDMHLHKNPVSLTERAEELGLSFEPPPTPRIEMIIAKCLEKDPALRYQNSSDLLNELIEEEQSLHTQTHEDAEDPQKKEHDDKKNIYVGQLTAVAISLALLMVSAVFFYILTPDVKQPEAKVPREIEKVDLAAGAADVKIDDVKDPSQRRTNAHMLTKLMSDDQLKKWIDENPNANYVNLDSTTLTSKGLSYLKNCKQLEELSTTGMSVRDNMIAYSEIRSLTKLEFSNPPLDEKIDNLFLLEKLPKLNCLTFKQCLFAPGALNQLSKLKRLSKLNFGRCSHMEGHALKPLEACKLLTYLSLNRCNIDDSTLISIPNLPVHQLKLRGNTKVTNDGVEAVAYMPRLKYFSILESNTNYADGLKRLRALRRSLKLPPLKLSEQQLEKPSTEDERFFMN